MADDVIPRIRSVVINTTDEERLAGFWSELLGVESRSPNGHGFIWLRPQRPGAFSIAFQNVAAADRGSSPPPSGHFGGRSRGSHRPDHRAWVARTSRTTRSPASRGESWPIPMATSSASPPRSRMTEQPK